jgi:hypothetical protein
LPIAEYARRDGLSITGGYVYRGPSLPGLVGQYIYADYGSGRIWALPTTVQPATPTELIDTRLAIAAFGTDATGALFFCAFDGTIYRLARRAE